MSEEKEKIEYVEEFKTGILSDKIKSIMDKVNVDKEKELTDKNKSG